MFICAPILALALVAALPSGVQAQSPAAAATHRVRVGRLPHGRSWWHRAVGEPGAPARRGCEAPCAEELPAEVDVGMATTVRRPDGTEAQRLEGRWVRLSVPGAGTLELERRSNQGIRLAGAILLGLDFVAVVVAVPITLAVASPNAPPTPSSSSLVSLSFAPAVSVGLWIALGSVVLLVPGLAMLGTRDPPPGPRFRVDPVVSASSLSIEVSGSF